MKRNEIIKALEAKGYQAKKHDVVKNGRTFKAVVLNTGSNVNPVFYTNLITDKEDTPEDVADKIIEMSKACIGCPIDPEKLTDRDWIHDHLTIAVQRESDENLVKKPSDFAGIEEYLILISGGLEGSISVKVTPALLANARLPEEDAWLAAKLNLSQSVQIFSLQSMLSDTFGGAFGPEGEDQLDIHVVTTSYRTKGAAAILSRDDMIEFMEAHNAEKLIILPSSIHEALIIPYHNYMDMEYFSKMVKEINATHVAPEDQLADRAYLYEE